MSDEGLQLTVDVSDPAAIVGIVISGCSALVSIVGSATILVKIIRDRARNGSTTPYDRFMIGLSCGDIVFSIYVPISSFLWAIASPASCKAWGVVGTLTSVSTWYNGLLSCYFLTTVLSQVRGKNVVKRFEPWLHLSAIYFPISAIAVYGLGGVRPNDLGTTCEVDPIVVILFLPVVLAFLLMIVNYSVIYAVVRKTLKSSNDFSSENVEGSTPVRNQLFRESTTIMVLYVASFLVTWLPFFAIICFLLLGVDLENIFGLVLSLLTVILFPLQGFFNAMIYLKPFYTRFRAAYPNKSKWFVLHQAVINSKAPRKLHRRIANHFTHHSNVLITDVTLGEEEVRVVNPNEALFYPGRMPSSIEPFANDVSEREENGAVPDNVEESD